MVLCRLKYTMIFKIGKKRKRNLSTNIRNLKLPHNKTQMLYSSYSSHRSIAYKTCCFIIPFSINKIDGIF